MVEVDDLVPGPEEVVVRLHAVGVNPVDTYVRSGTYGERPLPYTPGSDAAGVIAAVGATRVPLPRGEGAAAPQGFSHSAPRRGATGGVGVTRLSHWKVGDRVYLAGSQSGTYAEMARCLPEQVFPLPDAISFAQGAGLFVPYSTAYRALFQRGRALAGECVLVHGASGSVGLAAVQWARAHGLRVIGTAGTEAGLEAVRAAGADFALSHQEVAEKIGDLTDGRGPDLILEMLANVNLQKDLDMIARYGRVVVIGNRGSLEFNPRATMAKDADVRGMSLFNTPPVDLRRIQLAIIDGLKAGFLRPTVGRQFSLEQAPQAHQAVMEPGASGKIVLLP